MIMSSIMIDQSSFLFDFKLFSSTKESLLSQIESHLQTGKKLLTIFTPNPEQIVQSISNTSFGSTLRAADVLIPDGIGLVWASRLLSQRTKQPPLRERIAGRDVIAATLARASLSTPMLIIGGRDYANRTLHTKKNTFTIGHAPLFWTQGYMQATSPLAREERELELLLRKLRPSLVFVAFGAPHQEAWIIEHTQLLTEVGTKIVLSAGGAFDMLLGIVPRAPLWLQQFGLEWLFRLVQQPWRWRRQLRLLVFVGLVLREFILPRRRLSQA